MSLLAFPALSPTADCLWDLGRQRALMAAPPPVPGQWPTGLCVSDGGVPGLCGEGAGTWEEARQQQLAAGVPTRLGSRQLPRAPPPRPGRLWD